MERRWDLTAIHFTSEIRQWRRMKVGERERERGGLNVGDRVVIWEAADGFNSCIILCILYWIKLHSFARVTLWLTLWLKTSTGRHAEPEGGREMWRKGERNGGWGGGGREKREEGEEQGQYIQRYIYIYTVYTEYCLVLMDEGRLLLL